MGGGGEAVLNVKNGARLVSDETLIGDATNGSDGLLFVVGDESRFDSTSVAVGKQGKGTLLIQTGANARIEENLIISEDPSSQGELIVRGVGVDGLPTKLEFVGLLLEIGGRVAFKGRLDPRDLERKFERRAREWLENRREQEHGA